jgi:hypothetical protein
MNLVAFHPWTQGEYRLWVPHLPRRSVCFLTEKSSVIQCIRLLCEQVDYPDLFSVPSREARYGTFSGIIVGPKLKQQDM